MPQIDQQSRPERLTTKPSTNQKTKAIIQSSIRPSVFIAGSVAVDLSCNYRPFQSSKDIIEPRLKTSNPASINQSIGGVGHNVARAAHLTSPPGTVRLCSMVADDLSGNLILSTLNGRSMDMTGTKVLPSDQWRTAQYVAVNDAKKSLVLAMADMDIVGSSTHDFDTIWLPMLEECSPKWVVVDGNWHLSLVSKWLTASKIIDAKVAFEPVSVEKSKRLFPRLTAGNKVRSSSTLR